MVTFRVAHLALGRRHTLRRMSAAGEDADSTGQSETTICVTCGTAPTDPATARLSWARGVERGRVVWTCADCSRRHVRSIEGKLDSEWW